MNIVKKSIMMIMILLFPNIGMAQMAKETNQEIAIFAGGCFWCMEKPFDQLEGVISTISGYTGGKVRSPTYEQVSAGGTGYIESLQVTFDPSKTTYQKLLEVFWKNIDPLDDTGQFCDKGEQYKSAVFYKNEQQKQEAEKSLKDVKKELGAKISTKIIKASEFYPAEEYHQDYYKKNPIRYSFYRYNCGRDARLKEIWNK